MLTNYVKVYKIDIVRKWNRYYFSIYYTGTWIYKHISIFFFEFSLKISSFFLFLPKNYEMRTFAPAFLHLARLGINGLKVEIKLINALFIFFRLLSLNSKSHFVKNFKNSMLTFYNSTQVMVNFIRKRMKIFWIRSFFFIILQ